MPAIYNCTPQPNLVIRYTIYWHAETKHNAATQQKRICVEALTLNTSLDQLYGKDPSCAPEHKCEGLRLSNHFNLREQRHGIRSSASPGQPPWVTCLVCVMSSTGTPAVQRMGGGMPPATQIGNPRHIRYSIVHKRLFRPYQAW